MKLNRPPKRVSRLFLLLLIGSLTLGGLGTALVLKQWRSPCGCGDPPPSSWLDWIQG